MTEFSKFSPLDHIKTDEDLALYVEAHVKEIEEQRDQLQAAIDQECKWNWFEDGIDIADHVHSLEQAYKQGREEVIMNLKKFATKTEGG